MALCQRRPLRLLGLLSGLVVLGALSASRLSLHTDMAELLPDAHPAVQALRRLAGRQKSSTSLVLLIEAPDEAQTRRFAADLRRALAPLVPRVFTEIYARPDDEVPRFLWQQRWLYADLADLLRAEELLDRVLAQRSSPLAVDLEGDPEAELRALQQRLRRAMPAAVPGAVAATPGTNPGAAPAEFAGWDGGIYTVGLMLFRRGDGVATLDDEGSLAAALAAAESLRPTSYHPALRVRPTGPIALSLAEQRAIREGLTLSTGLCLLGVLLSIHLYFRRPLLLLAIGAPAVAGLLLSLGLFRLGAEALNANTAFLISIVLGNGINTPILLLARFTEARRDGAPLAGALHEALRGSLAGTVTATLAAGLAYGALLLTSFRGFSQFGLIGGAGMLLVWLLTYLGVPPLLVLIGRIAPGQLVPRPGSPGPLRHLGRLIERRSGAVLLLCAALTGACAVALPRYLRDPLEWDFNRLRTHQTEAERLWARMYALGLGNVGAGPIATDAVLLVDRAADADAVAQALRAQDRRSPSPLLKEVRTLGSMLPADQPAKLAVLMRLRAQIDRHRHLLDADEAALVQELRPPDTLRALGVADLPARVRDSFTEVDGTVGRLIGIDADPARFSDWNGHDLLQLSRALTVQVGDQTYVAASTSTVFAGMLEAILRDGPRVTAWALALVTALVCAMFGPARAGPILASLLCGVLWLLGLCAALGLRLNFVNFVALPITLGVGADYAANIGARLRQGARPAEALGPTGGAVALCSLTTIIGYSSLLLSGNRALQSFGLLADLGEVTCLLSALLVLPALTVRTREAHERIRGTG